MNKTGNGSYFYSQSGAIYEGEWANDMRNGYGTFSIPFNIASDSPTAKPVSDSKCTTKKTDAKKGASSNRKAADTADLKLRKVYAGEWVNDKREGKGTYFYDDGGWYDGMWSNDQKEGWGRMHYMDSSIYEGEWHREMRHGQGVLLLRMSDMNSIFYFLN
jgi:hypothetical protein